MGMFVCRVRIPTSEHLDVVSSTVRHVSAVESQVNDHGIVRSERRVMIVGGRRYLDLVVSGHVGFRCR